MTDEEQREQQRKELEKLGVRIIEAPMLTEDGFINPVFEAELEGAINQRYKKPAGSLAYEDFCRLNERLPNRHL